MKLKRKLDKHQRLCIPKEALEQIGFTSDEGDKILSIDVIHVDGRKAIVLEKAYNDNESTILKG